MASMKALGLMVIWTIVAVFIFNALGIGEHHTNPVWAIGGGILLLAIFMVNVWIYFLVARDEPWKWFK